MINYKKEEHPYLKYKFPNSELFETNYSQAHQDMFVLSMLNGKQKGIFLEIGAYHPTYVSNTYLLDKYFNWQGVSIDINTIPEWSDFRNTKLLCQDALTIDYNRLLKDNNFPSQIDYLQLDIEPNSNTLECLKRIPFNDYRFSVITYETDAYDFAPTKQDSINRRNESREILLSHGYELIVGNICNTSPLYPFEDWYVDPTVVSPELIKLFKNSEEYNLTSDFFMLNK